MRRRLQTPVSEAEHAAVERQAKVFGLTVAEYVRMRLGLQIKRARGRPPLVDRGEPAGR